MARLERYRMCTVRYRPLGSPTDRPNVLYVRCVPCPASGHRPVVQVGTRGWVCRVGAGGWVYRVGYYPATLVYPYIGIARAQPMASPRFCVRQGTPGQASWPSAHPGSSHSVFPYLGPIRRDSVLNILKLVINPGCHRKACMRPAILPISK